jgi:hypothetical protein
MNSTPATTQLRHLSAIRFLPDGSKERVCRRCGNALEK